MHEPEVNFECHPQKLFETGSLTETWDSPARLGGLLSKSQKCSFATFPVPANKVHHYTAASFMCTSVLLAHVCVYHEHTVSAEARRGHQILLEVQPVERCHVDAGNKTSSSARSVRALGL